MTSRFANPNHKLIYPRPSRLALAGLVALITVGDASAGSGRSKRSAESIAARPAGEPIMAVISLRNQRITVYDADGWIFRSPVSSGSKGHETPAGIFSIIQKKAKHFSNIYNNASMPHMQRITWSGIALHAGALPGYPASHGCVRLPSGFAKRFFGATELGMRVIVAPSDVAPVEIAHPALFPSKPDVGAFVADRAAAAEEATRKAGQARLAAVTASREAARATMPVRVAENLMRRAEGQLAAAETALGSILSVDMKERAEDTKVKAAERVFELQVQAAAAKADLQRKLDAVAPAREAAVVAEAARVAAAAAALEAERELEPVSVFVSRKTQRLYVRRGFEAILESPVTILDADRPIGTHSFTAMKQIVDSADMLWSVVTLVGERPNDGQVERRGPARKVDDRGIEPTADTDGAKAAIDRVVIPQDVRDRIAQMASPRSSLIISDEAMSTETGKGTDFVVLLSGEPQGGIKTRRRRYRPPHRPRYRQPYREAPFMGWDSIW